MPPAILGLRWVEPEDELKGYAGVTRRCVVFLLALVFYYFYVASFLLAFTSTLFLDHVADFSTI